MFRKLVKDGSRIDLACLRRTRHSAAPADFPPSRDVGKPRRGSTIYALSSGYGKCGVAVIRISGPEASAALEKMTRIPKLEPRKAFLRKIRDPGSGEVLDKGLCLWFPAPNSFTGEDSVEFHVHGGPAVISSVSSALSKLRFQPAGPGEFTKRAFFNGKLDLTEAEGIGDLIDAETEKQRKQAARQVDGNLRRLYDDWRTALVHCMANLEAYVDFSEENDVEPHVLRSAELSLRKLAKDMEEHLADGRRGEILRSGARLVILGEPNAGKSSLLNLLSRKEAAIVTSAPGTTRDVLEVTTDIAGYPVILADTAGIRHDPENPAEEEGIRRARNRAESADLVLCLMDAEKFGGDSYRESLEEYAKSLGLRSGDQRVVPVVNKVDLLRDREKEQWRQRGVVAISCKTEEGLRDLVGRLEDRCKELCGDPSTENPAISRERYRNHLTLCLEHIYEYFERAKHPDHDLALSIYKIRRAAHEVGMITGHVSTEEILDVIFKKFCVGK